jgi:hypothetical protein
VTKINFRVILFYIDLSKCIGIEFNISFIINSALYTLVVDREYDYKYRFFGLCESCCWTGTILRLAESDQCPVCHSQEIALLPLSTNERYEYDGNLCYNSKFILIIQI